MRYRVSHITTYSYSSPVVMAHHHVHLLPRDTDHQSCHRERIVVNPAPQKIERGNDYYGNHIVFFAIGQAHSELTIRTTSDVEVRAAPVFISDQSMPWEVLATRMASQDVTLPLELHGFRYPSELVPFDEVFLKYGKGSFKPGRPILAAAIDLMHRIYEDFTYDPKATDVNTPVLEVLEEKRGVCQDFAHVFIGCLRALGLPARYVSGYLRTVKTETRGMLIGADASHAWVSVWDEHAGWVDLDPTNDKVCDEDHITVAYGRDYSDVSPTRGVILGGGHHTVHVAVEVKPMAEN